MLAYKHGGFVVTDHMGVLRCDSKVLGFPVQGLNASDAGVNQAQQQL